MILLFNIIFIAFIGGIIVFIREYQLKKKKHLRRLQEVDILHKEELLKMQSEIQLETMRHIGREMHDNVGQKLTLSSLYLQQLIYENKTPSINEKLENINAVISNSLNDLRSFSKSLTDNTIEKSTISELIKNECRKVNELKQLNATFKNEEKVCINSYQTKGIILRITQEFIQNSLKHSNCKNIFIKLSSQKANLLLILEDDGIGFNTSKIYNGIGLQNIKRRINLINGETSIESYINKGTTLTVKIPLNEI